MDANLVKQFIELEKKHVREKIGDILEDKLKHDPENIDLLFRMAMLNIYPPFVDYPTCCMFFERVIAVSRKHQAIAALILSCIKMYGEYGHVLKHSILWLNSGKNINLINDFVKQMLDQINHHCTCDNIPEETKISIENELSLDPGNIDLLFLLAIMEIPKLGIRVDSTKNHEESIAYLEKIITISKENEAIATVFFAYIVDLGYVMEEELLNRLNSLHTDNPEINSMLKYAGSWFYHSKRDTQLEEKYLKESIDLYQGLVWNYVDLAKLYQKQGFATEANKLVQKALANVKKVYGYGSNRQVYDPTSLNERLNELVKGIYLSGTNHLNIQELL